ncbi:MAG: nucleoside-diphosphate kinase [Actinomycetota bacterium]|nr:nucleoside-diphosphate kinase [Actinomycetota bacterium]MDG1198529.1 nucleoside-diphosphate kinase [Actinomycetota bacterium]MDG2120807.1 nucleoside-diphosphate kinase [Actinomycetota bacterium]
MAHTFVICKPDAVERGLVGEIISRIERKGLSIKRAELRLIDRETAALHYMEHDGKPFFEDLLNFITRSPAMLLQVEGSDDAGDDIFAVVRNLMGSTNPATAAPGTIRGDFGLLVTENLVHGSDSVESAAREIGIFFQAN